MNAFPELCIAQLVVLVREINQFVLLVLTLLSPHHPRPWLAFVVYYAPAPVAGALSDDARLTSVCLSVAYIGPKSRTERPRKTKIDTEVTHVTRTPLSRSKVNLQGAGHIVAASRTVCFDFC